MNDSIFTKFEALDEETLDKIADVIYTKYNFQEQLPSTCSCGQCRDEYEQVSPWRFKEVFMEAMEEVKLLEEEE